MSRVKRSALILAAGVAVTLALLLVAAVIEKQLQPVEKRLIAACSDQKSINQARAEAEIHRPFHDDTVCSQLTGAPEDRAAFGALSARVAAVSYAALLIAAFSAVAAVSSMFLPDKSHSSVGPV